MGDHDRLSRVDKYEKRRKTTKSISILVVIGSILIVLLISVMVFGGKDKSKSEDVVSPVEITETDETDDETTDNDDEADEVEENEDNNTDVELETVPSDDDNVMEAYKGNWEPIGTTQEEPHEVSFQRESEDWAEMVEAIKIATGLTDMTIHWLGNGGEQKAIGTVSTKDQSDIYKVYLSWVTNEGWLPTKVEKLKEVVVD